jgi:hypothetical protein
LPKRARAIKVEDLHNHCGNGTCPGSVQSKVPFSKISPEICSENWAARFGRVADPPCVLASDHQFADFETFCVLSRSGPAIGLCQSSFRLASILPFGLCACRKRLSLPWARSIQLAADLWHRRNLAVPRLGSRVYRSKCTTARHETKKLADYLQYPRVMFELFCLRCPIRVGANPSTHKISSS